jgi:hypothetical protein
MITDRLEETTMTAAPVRNLLFGALLLVCAWVPAATLAAPHPHAVSRAVDARPQSAVRAARQIEQAAAPDLSNRLPDQRT